MIKNFIKTFANRIQLQQKTLFQFTQNRDPEELPYLELTRDFLNPKEFYELLQRNEIQYYTGVPDSLLKDFCAYLTDNVDPKHHIITANEGSAIATAVGLYLATKKVPLVYLQNSGLGNIINPLMSLAHRKVYGIPMLLLIGWRGEPGKKDEPQHLIQGQTMNSLITEMGIQFEVLPDFIEGATETVQKALEYAKKKHTPFALIVKRQCFTNYKLKNKIQNSYPMNRERAVELILKQLGSHDIVVATTGFLSRELYEIREKMEQGHERDFLTVGSMGHAIAIATGIAQIKQSRQVWCFDGDGSCLMHLGSVCIVGQLKQKNLKHLIFNNEAHDSVGAQPTAASNVDFQQMALSVGYKQAFQCNDEKELIEKIEIVKNLEGPVLLEIKIKPGARKNLGRPKTTPYQNKDDFMEFLNV